MALSRVWIFLVIVAAAAAEVANFHGCSGVPRDRCSISEVRITPCPKPKKCLLVKGENATISFDFTPSFSSDKLQAGIFWQGQRFSDLGESACELTKCPTVAGSPQTLTYTLYIADKYPRGDYNINFKLWNEDDAENDVCCFLTTIKIPDRKKH